MHRILPLTAIVLASCTPAPQKAAMPSPSASPEPPIIGTSGSVPASDHRDSPAEAQGRRILSTAFVTMGPDGHMTVELHDGHVLVLSNIVMNPADYCGVHRTGDGARTKYCGGYAEVAAARPGGAPSPDQPDPIAAARQ